jgi:uncharacterized protein (DUF2236 family)
VADAFSPRGSIVRTIWGDPDLVLLIFAGSAAEFALNRAVDWLFFTGRIPADPIGRLFSTVHYAQRIIFTDAQEAQRTLASINAAHARVEIQRGQRIPEWAHRDVLYMLIDQTQRAYELLCRRLTGQEREELYAAFLQVGRGLNVQELPATYAEWQEDRERHLRRDLENSDFTRRLYEEYRRHLGPWRYWILLQVQGVLVAEPVRQLLRLRRQRLLMAPSLQVYAWIRALGLQRLVQRALVPPRYWAEVQNLGAQGAQ